ncbi:MAG: hypothetical protein ACYC3G_00640 [Minisyncoccota bacterium]
MTIYEFIDKARVGFAFTLRGRNWTFAGGASEHGGDSRGDYMKVYAWPETGGPARLVTIRNGNTRERG